MGVRGWAKKPLIHFSAYLDKGEKGLKKARSNPFMRLFGILIPFRPCLLLLNGKVSRRSIFQRGVGSDKNVPSIERRRGLTLMIASLTRKGGKIKRSAEETERLDGHKLEALSYGDKDSRGGYRCIEEGARGQTRRGRRESAISALLFLQNFGVGGEGGGGGGFYRGGRSQMTSGKLFEWTFRLCVSSQN